jgi:outer membrane lipoprotein-sorting protein
MKRLVALGALLLAACGGGHPRPDNPIEDPKVVLAEIQKRSEAIASLSAELRVEIWRKGERVRLRQLIEVERPDKLRVDTLSPFDQPLQMMASDGHNVSIYSLEKKRFWQGPATPDNLARLLPLRLEGEELASLLRGGVPLIQYADATMGWDAERGCYQVDLTGPARRQRLCVEPKALRVAESRVWKDDHLQYSALFGQYTGEDAAAIPTRMRFEVPSDDLRVEVEVVDHKLNPQVAPDAFQIEAPRGIEVEPLE